MTILLFVVTPLGLLAAVLLFCFVGCDPNTSTSQQVMNYKTYSGGTVLPTPGLLGYWQLSETGPTATDSSPGTNDGTFMWASFTADASLQSDGAPGVILQASPGIVPGDYVQPANTTRVASADFDGGYVIVPSGPTLNPPQGHGFTIEAWVRVKWSQIDPAAYRVVLSSQAYTLSAAGYALYATPANCWEVWVGDPSNAVVTSGPSCFPNTTYYLAATYDPSTFTLTLYVDGVKAADVQTNYGVNWSDPLYIGAGSKRLPAGTVPSSLLYPFKGQIQNVAIYKGALDANTIATHAARGNGMS